MSHRHVRISVTIVCIITSAVASAVGSIFMQQIADNSVVTPASESGLTLFSNPVPSRHGRHLRRRCMVATSTPHHGDRTCGSSTCETTCFDGARASRFFRHAPRWRSCRPTRTTRTRSASWIAKSIPTLIQSGLIVALVGTMLYSPVWPSLVVLVVGVLMVFLTGKLRSRRFMKGSAGGPR